ncbi:DNA adenine methylase [Bifidobacterium sp. ESL0769]|uniref:DNA adenine methylase n=1 Tax=Bifidobacterium sp. ESL0769 TaxID=2983229 RepID=UPI0023F83505|nr:DNA adenine methylase [Bifidobacterium sp. ESL0769]WEV67045.1 DNA adenine methylase [Bifidobacterium sp. ESL0769]
MRRKNLLRPIVKWVGGKRQLLDEIVPSIPTDKTYVEPFLGGGAVLLALKPKHAIINDANSELINVYTCVRDDTDELVKRLKEHKEQNHDKGADYFYEIRAMDRNANYSKKSKIDKAARIIYLNKTCFNGLYRVNSAGQFNSPYGRYKNPDIVNEVGIRALAKYLQENDVKIFSEDYTEVLATLNSDSFVYLDPPYMPISSSSSFTGYTEGGFNYQAQQQLKEECDKLHDKGVNFIESNSDCEEIRELYSEYKITKVKARRVVNSRADRRGEINEVLIYG